jgi:hypothetical protein
MGAPQFGQAVVLQLTRTYSTAITAWPRLLGLRRAFRKHSQGPIEADLIDAVCDPTPAIGARSGCGILAPMVTFRTRGRLWWLGGAITTTLVATLAEVLPKQCKLPLWPMQAAP